ncbi:MAG: M3 family metallopeptidase, partial [Planctomycetota bacterium]|nr:M3 family metallopeptidase [Planctomycetota bacterium]
MKLCIPALFLLASFVACSTQGPQSFEQISSAAAEQGLILVQPKFEQTPSEVVSTVDSVLAMADAALDSIATQDPATATFESTFAALDSAVYPMMTVMNRYWLMKETRQEPEIREACTSQVQRLSEWGVEVEYREDLYRICNAVSARIESGDLLQPEGEDAQLYRDTMRDYRRAGFNLDSSTREKVAKMKNKLSKLESDFDSNITNSSVTLEFVAEDLAGVPESFLESSKTQTGKHAVRVTVTPDYMAVMENCSVRKTRRKVNAARYSVAMDENGPILNKIVRLRGKMASLLGYSTWADYKIEPKMASTGGKALDFAEGLARGLQPKFDAEVAELRELMVAETGNTDAQIQWWDFRYYQNQLMKEHFSVDSEALRNYFPLKEVISGMFGVYQHIFDLRFTQVEPDYKWVDDLELWAVEDANTGEAMGMFYLDLYPRPGKYNHFAQFDII